MPKLSYKDQLLHPNWQKKRLQMLEAANWHCGNCGSDETTLHVHHLRYVKGRMVWEYGDEELEVLCEDCHKQRHADKELLDAILTEAIIAGDPVGQAVGILGGFFAGCMSIDPATEDAAISVDGHSHDLGILASIASGADWKRMAAAVEVLAPKSMSPAEEAAYRRWKGES